MSRPVKGKTGSRMATGKTPAADQAAGGRFRKGQSGNPKGRPRKSPAPPGSAFDIVIERTLTVTRHGQPREITMEEALQHRTYQDAIAGKRTAQREVLKWIRKREDWLARQANRRILQPITRLSSGDPANADAALLLLGIATRDDSWDTSDPADLRLRLEPWAVQAALARRRAAGPLSAGDIAHIVRCTRDAEMLDWPRGARHER